MKTIKMPSVKPVIKEDSVAHTETYIMTAMKISETENQKRRAYWRDTMEEGHRFMTSVTGHPVEECYEQMLPLREACSVAGVEVVFSDTDIIPGISRKFYLRAALIPKLLAAADEFNSLGFILKIEDAYRDREMQRGLALKESLVKTLAERLLWECGGEEPMAALIVRRLAVLIAHCPKTGTHMSGSAMDISVLHRKDGTEVDRGRPYLELSELTPMSTPFISEKCRENRELITAIMQKHGFIAYPYEFWHYSSGDSIAEYIADSSVPGRYGPIDLNMETGEVSPIADPEKPLNPPEILTSKIHKALQQ
jgi:zinc D-Ala-D-Ala dipeptidase